jgi:hypothetical protein
MSADGLKKPRAISGFRPYVREIYAPLGYYAVLRGGSVPMFRYILLVPSSKVKKSKKKALSLYFLTLDR